MQRFLTLSALKANRQTLLDYNAAHKLFMVAGFMAIYIVQTAISLPGAAILSQAAGAIFGSTTGMDICTTAISIWRQNCHTRARGDIFPRLLNYIRGEHQLPLATIFACTAGAGFTCGGSISV
jgi:hypothetical protein